ncbi:uncharacterized protein LOC107608198 [Arachis ipaensis]|uniref:uncharacterized protein LOC107608198 n=1 Tax=Arachis ipaensis TaxID=130454 RepID=UPI000A2B87E8|nr:uncharacterized protein LOC107608198 [Arachis ipaensis]
MAKANAQESYQRVQKAKARSRARTGGVRAVISPPPPPRNVGTPSQPIVISSSTFSQPPPSARPSSEPENKKRKTLESGSSGEVKADALAFVRKNIYPNVRISMDDVSVVIDGAIVDPPVPEIISESDLKTRGQRIIESPPRPKDAPSSSTVPLTSSSSPMDASLPGPGGAPSSSGGGDLSTPLAKK